MELLDIERDSRDVAIMVCIKGEVDSSTVDALIAALDAAVVEAQTHPARILVIDLDDVTFSGCSQRADAGGALAPNKDRR